MQEGSLEEFTDVKVTFWWPLVACQVRSCLTLASWLTFFSPCFIFIAQDGVGGHYGDLRILEAPCAHSHLWRLHYHAEAARWAYRGHAKSCRKRRRRGCKSSNALCCASSGVTYLVDLLTTVKGHSREHGWKWWTDCALRGAVEPLHLPGVPSAPKS